MEVIREVMERTVFKLLPQVPTYRWHTIPYVHTHLTYLHTYIHTYIGLGGMYDGERGRGGDDDGEDDDDDGGGEREER